ncbi:hypothetical protein HDU86_002766 [Geranomyces michiganensis]|nr:hypothetical protein HDU86_002766 [Geranomyces michiganensis]
MDAVFNKIEAQRAERKHANLRNPRPLPRGLNPRPSEHVEPDFDDDNVVKTVYSPAILSDPA